LQPATAKTATAMQNLPLSMHGLIKGVNILVVDNDSDSRYLWTFLLEEYGATVMAFESIKDALTTLKYCVPNLLICETRFLGESVIPLFDRIKGISADHETAIPILITSTCSSASFVNIFHHTGVEAVAYLLKPIEIEDFVDTVLKLIFLPSLALSI
jgi:response regulator RpfG family c-di-GMP phosphodiesterase